MHMYKFAQRGLLCCEIFRKNLLAGVTRCYIKKYEITTIVALNYVISIGYRDSQHKGRIQLLNLFLACEDMLFELHAEKITNRCPPASPELAMAGRLRDP